MADLKTEQGLVPIADIDVKDVEVLTVGKDIRKKPIDYHDYIRRYASENDYENFIDHSLIIKDVNDRPVIVYLHVPDMPSLYMVKALRKIYFSLDKRTQGLVSRSKVFGYLPREVIRKDYCSSSALSREHPDTHRYICEFGALLAKFYEKYCPDTFKMHMELTNEKILKDWQIDRSPFTSGIINKNIALKYHFDAGNIKNVYSNMVSFKKDCAGGHLAIPEYNIGLEIANKSMLLFDGQAIMHGVTPFKLESLDAYRYTLVYYTLRDMWSCKPINEEIARIRQVKFERELRRYKRLTGELKPEEDPLLSEFARSRAQRARRKALNEAKKVSQVATVLQDSVNKP